MLQFRANEKVNIRDTECEVDCWAIPRENEGGCTLRYSLYRLLVQGFRKCQGLRSLQVSLNRFRPSFRQFYSGSPVWMIDGQSLKIARRFIPGQWTLFRGPSIGRTTVLPAWIAGKMFGIR
jgi:hypothetical protein